MGSVLVGFIILLALIFLEVPIAWAMSLVGVFGFAYFVGIEPALHMLGSIANDTVLSYSLSVVPLFILMGNFVARSRISQDLFDGANSMIGHWRGGLSLAALLACGGFAAVCGSSLATAATMTKVAMPSMRRYGYASSLAAGSIAAGGSLGILIPPSIMLVIYGIITETDIGKLFIAGVIPGLVGILFYMGAVFVTCRIHPEYGPAGEKSSWAARRKALWKSWGMLLLFLLVMGGIYLGVFTPTEAAGIGASGAFFFAWYRRTLNISLLIKILADTGRTSATILFIVVGANLFSNFLNVAGAPNLLASWVGNLDASPTTIILTIMVIFVIFGCIFESMSIMVLTVPILFPIVSAQGVDPIWFGILCVVSIEIGLITPPVGLNLFVVNAIEPDISVGTICKGITPFVVADICRLSLLIFVPWLSLFLPELMR